MSPFFWMAGCYLLYSITIVVISLIEWEWRNQTEGCDSFSTIGSCFPLSVSMLFYKWLQFSAPFFVPIIGVGSFFLAGFSQNSSSLFGAIWNTFEALWIGILVVTFIFVAVQHLFGRRVGQFLFLFADFAVTDDEILFQSYWKWHSVPWTSVIGMNKQTFLVGGAYGTTLKIAYESPLPNWYQHYLFGSNSTWTLLIWNMQPGSRELIHQIEHKLQNLRSA